MVFSATVRGFSDIFLYYPATRQSQRITTDFWDDLDAIAVKVRGRTGILFASNRTNTSLEARRLDTILPITNYDLFYYDISNRPGELVRVTDTPLANERKPIGIDTTYFAYLSDRSGFYNREVGYLEDYIDHYDQRIILEDGTEIVLHADSTLSALDTTLIDTIEIFPIIKERAIVAASSNYARNLGHQHVALHTGRLLEYFPMPDAIPGQLQLSNINAKTIPSVNNSIYQYGRRAVLLTQEEGSDEGPAAVDTQLTEVPPLTTPPPAVEVTPPAAEFVPDVPPTPAAVDSTKVIDIDNYLFQSEFAEEETFAEPREDITVVQPATDLEEIVNFDAIPSTNSNVRDKHTSDVYRFRPGRITPYRTTFRTDFVTFNMDNNLLFEGMDSYAANPNGFNSQPLSLLLKANFKDLFEDYVVEGGMRLPTSFNGTEYFLIMHNRKHRLDRFYAVYRRNQRFSEEGESFVPWRRENNVVLGQYGIRYPLDIFQSLRATGTLRRDRVQYLATDQTALEEAPAPDRTQRVGLRLEYVFDNTLDLAMNLKQGTRAKVYTEYYKSFSASVDPKFSFNFDRGFLGVVGIDARHYLKIDKRSILAFRLAGAVSFGADRILYYLGGTDNSLLPSFNTTIPTPVESPGFVTLANNMRGFDLNIRNGNSYILANIETRIPLFRYFSENIRSPFFRNFQLVGFFDAGTAWSGPDPYSDENPLNTTTFPENPTVFTPVSARVVYFRDPLVFSYGIGARALLFGYMVRLDYAWGLETRNVLDPKLHISLGMDF